MRRKVSNSSGTDSEKRWWAPVWNGLVMDQNARHYRRMKNAIWLFLYLLIHADRRTGLLVRKVGTASRDMGVSRDTISRWLAILKRENYIETRSTGRFLSIEIRKWKKLPEVGNIPQQMSEKSNTRGWKNPTSQSRLNDQDSARTKQNPSKETEPNDISIKKGILKIDIDNKKYMKTNSQGEKPFQPKTREELLAMDLAAALNDRVNLPLYLSFAKKYPEPLLRKILGIVKEIPEEKIRKSRGALFNYLIQKHGRRTPDNSGN